MDPRECQNLQRVALRNVDVQGLVALPASCHLHVFGEPHLGHSLTLALADRVSGVLFCHKLDISPHSNLLQFASVMSKPEAAAAHFEHCKLEGSSAAGI